MRLTLLIAAIAFFPATSQAESLFPLVPQFLSDLKPYCSFDGGSCITTRDCCRGTCYFGECRFRLGPTESEPQKH